TQENTLLLWDDHRQLKAVNLAARLPQEPMTTSILLSQSEPGCELMIERWQSLGQRLDEHGTWRQGQRSQALDLWGVSGELREAELTLFDGVPVEAFQALATAVVSRELARLVERRDSEELQKLDAWEYVRVECGLTVDQSPEGKLLARYESRASRKLQWAVGQLKQPQEGRRGQAEAGRGTGG